MRGTALARPEHTYLPASSHPGADSGFASVVLILATVLPAPVIAVVMPNRASPGKSSTDCSDKAPDSSCAESGLGHSTDRSPANAKVRFSTTQSINARGDGGLEWGDIVEKVGISQSIADFLK